MINPWMNIRGNAGCFHNQVPLGTADFKIEECLYSYGGFPKWGYPGTPKSSIKNRGLSILNHPLWGPPIYIHLWKPPISYFCLNTLCLACCPSVPSDFALQNALHLKQKLSWKMALASRLRGMACTMWDFPFVAQLCVLNAGPTAKWGRTHQTQAGVEFCCVRHKKVVVVLFVSSAGWRIGRIKFWDVSRCRLSLHSPQLMWGVL